MGLFIFKEILYHLDEGRLARRTSYEVLSWFQIKLLIGDRLIAVRTAMRKLLNNYFLEFIHYGLLRFKFHRRLFTVAAQSLRISF